MRSQKKQSSAGKRVLWAFLFSFFVFVIVALSFFIKLVGVLRVGLFDGDHRITILLQHGTKSNNVILASFLPKENRAVMFSVSGDVQKINSKGALSGLLGIPIDASVIYPFSLQGENDGEKTGQFLTNLFKTVTLHYSEVKTDLTIIDAAKLWFFVKGVPAHNLTYTAYQLSSDPQKMQDDSLDTVVASLFADSVITNEKVSIHIVNASGVSGFGNQFARIISNSGGNVIAVSTGDSILPTSEIAFTDKETYTLKKLEKILECKAIPVEKQTISDIVVILGKDRASLFR